jgi:alanyl-tRNA synthetase
VNRFFTEWKDQKKEIDRLSQRVVTLELERLQAELIGKVQVVIREVDLPARELALLAQGVAKEGGVALLVSASDGIRVVVSSADARVNAGEIASQVCELLGGKGGGKPGLAQGIGQNREQIPLALKVGKERIAAALHG